MNVKKYEAETVSSILAFCEHNRDALNVSFEYYIQSTKLVYTPIVEHQLESFLAKVDAIFLTANPIETFVLHKYISGKYQRQKDIRKFTKDNITFYFFNWHGKNFLHIWAGTIGSNTKYGSAKTLRRILSMVTPNAIFSIVVAFGSDYKTQNIGDVLISERIYAYDKGIKFNNGKLEVKNEHMYETNRWLIEKIRQHHYLFAQAMEGEHGPFHIYKGNMLTGEAVLSDQRVKNKIYSAFATKNFIGGEMEGYGLYDESNEHAVPCVVIKSICDWGSVKNCFSKDTNENDKIKDSIQAYAMLNTLTVCDKLFQEHEFLNGNVKESNVVFRELNPPIKKLHFKVNSHVLSLLVLLLSLIIFIVLSFTIFRGIDREIIYQIITIGTSFCLIVVTSIINTRQTKLTRTDNITENYRNSVIESIKEYLKEVAPEYLAARFSSLSIDPAKQDSYVRSLYQKTISTVYYIDVYYRTEDDLIERLYTIYQYINRILKEEGNDIINTSTYKSYCAFYKIVYEKLLLLIEKKPINILGTAE